MSDYPQDLWYAVADARELKDKPLGRTFFGQEFVLWRDAEGEPRAALDQCPHRGAALSIGEVKDGCIMCPFHGFLFDKDGACVEIPSGEKIPPAMRLRSVPMCEAHDWLFMWRGEERETYPDPPWFEDMPDYPSWFFYDDWPVHWTRAVENQLDFTHLRFVHRTTIGRLVPDGPVDLKMDVGPDHIRFMPGAQDAYVEWRAPNIWRNKIGPNSWGQAAFVPIDAQTSRTYVRAVQGMVTLPLLGDALARFMSQMNKVVLAQDRAVVSTQRPIRSHLQMGERLIASDRPIIEFRKWLHGRTQGEAEDHPDVLRMPR